MNMRGDITKRFFKRRFNKQELNSFLWWNGYLFKKIITVTLLVTMIWQSGFNITKAFYDIYKEDEVVNYTVPTEDITYTDTTTSFPSYPTTTDPDFDPSEVAITSEETDKRTATTKTFKKLDGTLETALYEQSIHYYDNGAWKQIDNSLNDLGQELENKENSFKLKFPKTIDDNKTIKFTENGYGIDWSILGINTSPIIYDDSVLTPNSIRELININRTVMYEDIFPGVDIEYVLFGDQLKENIILEQYVENFSLTFEYKLKDLTLIKDINGKYVFVNDLNEVVYQFTDLFMFDNNLDYSEDILLSVTELGNKTYEVTLTPSNEWLKNALYPVVIDPVFEDPSDGEDPDLTVDPDTGLPYNNPSIQDKEVSNNEVIENSYYQRVGRYNSNNYKTYIEVDFSSIPDDTIITYTHLLVGTYTNPTTTCSNSIGCVIEIRKVNQTSDWDDITNSSFSDVENFIDDYNIISDDMGIRRWDLSKVFYDWHSASYDVGILELSMEYGMHDNYISFTSETYSLLTGPNVIIGYQSTTGLYDYWTYHNASAGDAGTIMVSDYTGELSMIRNDYVGTHNGMVIDLGMFYNENLKDTDIGFGYGWRTSFSSTAFYNSPDYEIINSSGSKTRYVQANCSDVTDEPEIRNYSLDCYLANDGSREVLVNHNYDNDIDSEIIVYSTDRVRTIYEAGKLSKVEDLKSGYYINFYYSTYGVSKIEDHYGNFVALEYDVYGNLEYELVQLCQTWDTYDECTKTNLIEVIKFIYTTDFGNTGKNLTSVIYYSDYSGAENLDISNSSTQEFNEFLNNSSTRTINYTYDDGLDEDNKLRTAKSSTDVLVSVDYLSNTKVDKYTFTKGTSNLGFIEISYDKNATLFTDHKGNQVRYSFDSYGHTVNILDDFGNAIFNNYLNAFSDTINGSGNMFLHHKLVESSLPQKTQLNPISNHSFENSTVDDWDFVIDDDAGATAGVPYYSYSENSALFGEQGLRMDNYTYQASHLEQTIILDQGTYTLSGYVRSSTTSSHMRVSIGTTDYDSTSLSSTGEWIEKELQFTVSSDNTTVTIELHNKGYYSEYDNITISDCFVDTRVNILDNPSFESSSTGWALSGVSRVANNADTTEGDLHDSILGDFSLKITGDPFTRNYFETTLMSTQFNTGQYYIIAGWAKGDISAITSNLHGEDDKVYGILVTLSNGTTSEVLYYPFNSDIETWQYQANKFYVDSSITSIKVKVMFQGEGSVMFDGIQVYNESFGTEYAYDNYGNIDKIKLPDSDAVIQYGYSLDNRFFEEYSEYLYRKKWYVRDDGDQIAALGSERLAKKLTRNDDNKVTSIITGEDSNQDGTIDGDYFTNFYSYTNNQQHVDIITNEFGQQQDFDYNILTGLLDGFTNYNSISSTFTYDKYGRKKTHTMDGTSYTYHYDENELSEIEVNGMTYKLEYDSVGRLVEILIGTGTGTTFTGSTIKEYKYTEFGVDIDGDGIFDTYYDENTLSQGIYGNNDTILFNYNDEDLISSIEYGTYDPQTHLSTTVTRYELNYNSSNQISILKDYQQNKTYYYDYDKSGNLSKISDELGNIIEYKYDNFGNIEMYFYDIVGISNTTNYVYDNTVSLYDKTIFGNSELDYTYESNGLRRLTNMSLKINNYVRTSKTVDYYDNLGAVYGNASYRVKSIQYNIGGNNLTESFQYTNSGYISKITRTINTTSYIEEFIYDEKNQLIRENNEQRNYTYQYIYDEFGNLKYKKHYTYYEGNNNLPISSNVEHYIYDSIWKDKIIEINVGHEDLILTSPDYILTYSYDTIGNVIGIDDSRGTSNDVGFEWEGRNLISYNDISFTYNFEGVRNSKTVNGVTTKYYLDGYNVLVEETGSNQISYTYDYDGTLLSMNYNGVEYFYITNSLGDITHIIDSNGSIMVKYEYDAYGNTTYQWDSGLGLDDINPYRYRSYRYDIETGLYYLQSRYYNPETGRFINADGILKSSNTVLGLNMYAYAENNPIMNWDPTGYNCTYTDLNGDGFPSESEGGGCGGGANYWSSGGSYYSWSSSYRPGSTYGTYSTNDVFNTGYNSGMGNMITTYGPTVYWMTGVYVHGTAVDSRFSTGRTIPRNKYEAYHMSEVLTNPKKYSSEKMPKLDRVPFTGNWVKRESLYLRNNLRISNIHFIYNQKTGVMLDFKFVDYGVVK